MRKLFTVLLSLALLAALAPAFAASDVKAKGKDGTDKITNAQKKGAKDKIAPTGKDQKGGKKGGDKLNTPANK